MRQFQFCLIIVNRTFLVLISLSLLALDSKMIFLLLVLIYMASSFS